MNLENIFINVLASDQLNIRNDILEEFCYDLVKTDAGRKVSNEGGYQSNIFDMSTNPVCIDTGLHRQIVERVNAFHDYMGFKKSLKKIVDQCWVNINPPGTYNNIHTHNGGVITGVYYVKVPEGSGDLQMITPNPAFDFVMKDQYIETPNLFNASNVMIRPKEGYLYLFPCWIAHQVKMNLSTGSRISIAFDVALA